MDRPPPLGVTTGADAVHLTHVVGSDAERRGVTQDADASVGFLFLSRTFRNETAAVAGCARRRNPHQPQTCQLPPCAAAHPTR